MEDGMQVQLYIYDLSNGMAAAFSHSLLGKQIDGIWHTSIVVNQTEFYFGGGISTAPAGTTVFGRPHRTVDLGITHVPMTIIHELVTDLRNQFSDVSYDILSNNCNHFTDELAKLLIGTGIPEDIVKLPDAVMSTPLGQMLKPVLMGMQSQLGSVNEQRQQSESLSSNGTTGLVDREKAELEAAIRQEYAVLAAQGTMTSAQAAELAAQKVREICGKGDIDDEAKAK